jgi:glyoxylase-like metal-dependent hydrolase (beta-lactamase superfamily II)
VGEPAAAASTIEEVVPGVWHWLLEDDRIGGFWSAAHAVRDGEGAVLIDPLPADPAALAQLPRATAICLSSGSHQRSAWRLRRELGVQVYAPAAVQEVDEEPDVRYREGDVLPGSLQTFFTPGAGTTQHALLWTGGPNVLFTADLFVSEPGKPLELVPDEHLHDPAQLRESVERLLELDFDILCTGHGVPVTEDPKGAIRALL